MRMRKRRRNTTMKRNREIMMTIGIGSSHRSCGVRCHIGQLALVCMILQRVSKTQVCCDLFIAGHMHQYAMFPSDASYRRTPGALICTYMSF
eukprot:5831002-Pyramimonas_sp.AAC.1